MKKLTLVVSILMAAYIARSQRIPSWKITDVADYYGKRTDSVYIINFWATFCKPCVAEIPYLQIISNKYKDQRVKLLLVSLDLPAYYPHKVENFVRDNHFTADVVWLNESNADHFCPVIDKTWSGSMPATLFVNTATGYKKFIEAAMSEEQFEKELRNAIGKD